MEKKAVGLLGFGTVGKGAFQVIRDWVPGLYVKKILARHVPEGMEGLVTTDPEEVLNDPEICLIGEALPAGETARVLVSEALRRGKHVASANKALVCAHFEELHRIAGSSGAGLRFTPAAGGGIPWLVNLKRTLRADRVRSFRGIMNGTSNLILDAVQSRGIGYAEALAEAQARGFAEADPSADVDGIDARRKCAISAMIAFGCPVREEDIPTLGIRGISPEDAENFRELGRVCRLIARAEESGGRICASVGPVLLGADAPESRIRGSGNWFSLEAEAAGPLSFSGPGAGSLPTGQSLAQDLIDLAGPAPAGGNIVLSGRCRAGGDDSRRPWYLRAASFPEGLIQKRIGSAVLTRPLGTGEAVRLAEELRLKENGGFLAACPED